MELAVAAAGRRQRASARPSRRRPRAALAMARLYIYLFPGLVALTTRAFEPINSLPPTAPS